MFINNTIMLLQQPDGASRGAPEGSCLELFTVLLIFGCIFYFGRVTFLHQLVLCCVDFFLLMKSQSSVSNIRNITLSTWVFAVSVWRLYLQFLSRFLSLNLKVNILCLKYPRDHFKYCPIPPRSSSLLSHHKMAVTVFCLSAPAAFT